MKNLLIALGSGLLIGAAGMFYLNKPDTKSVQTEKETATTKKDIVTIVKEVTRADGTKEVVTTTTDKSTEKKDTSSSLVVQTAKANWLVGVSASASLDRLAPVYGIHAQRRVLGPAFVGIGLNTNKEALLSVAIEF